MTGEEKNKSIYEKFWHTVIEKRDTGGFYGWPVSKVGSRKKEELVMADCNLYLARD